MYSSDPPYLVGDVAGYSPVIGHLVSMMRWARYLTIESALDLSREQLDHLHDPMSNSIGALLLHIAGVEREYFANTIEGRELTDAETSEFGAALELGDRGRAEIRGHSIDYYLTTLERVRDASLKGLAERDDTWLFTELPFWGGRPTNHYFMWFHALEDEVSHRGQIRWLRRRLPK
jgi:uncharacterized damage-inducible protein DinB